MTLTTPYSATFIVGDGETKTFSYLFEEVSPNFISVMVYNSLTGLISTPTYVIDTDQKQVIFGEDTPAPTADETVCIYRNTPNVQDVAFRTLHGYDAQTLENILSKIVAMIQEIKSNYFSTQVLQGDPWQLDLLSSADDGATVNIDYTAKKLVKGLYFRITSGNLQVSADGATYLTLPKSDDVAEFRQYEQTLPDLTVIRKLQYRVGNQWFDAEANAQYTADEAYALAESVQMTMSAHINNTTNPHQTSLANLTDTDLTGLVANQFLRFNGIKWVPVYSSATVYWGEILGNIDAQTDLKTALDGKVEKAGDTMTGALNIANIASSNAALLTLTHSNTETYKWNIAPRYNSTTLSVYPGSTETNGFRFATTGFVPASNNARYLGSASLKWKGVYTGTLNNGADLTVPSKTGTLATMDDVELAARSGTQLTDQGVWYAKMYVGTVAPIAEDGTNYADFSQTDIKGNPIIVTYNRVNGAWVQDQTITPPAEYDGYVIVTSKIWDIVEQTDQQGGQVLWDHTHRTFTPYPHIVKADTLPDQTGNSGKFLTTDGTDASWAAVDALPSQTGQSGKFLTTDGTDASWSDKPLVNTATGSDSLTILGDATSASTALNIGPYSTAEGTYSLAIGPGSGDAHRVRATKTLGIAIGYDALCLALDSIQLGTGQLTTNYKFSVWNYTMLDKTTGKIPISRLGDDTSTTQGNVLTLDSNGAAVWQAPSGGGSAGQSIDAEIIGALTVASNGDVNGFSNSNYLQTPCSLDFTNASTFEIVVVFTVNNINTLSVFNLTNVSGNKGMVFKTYYSGGTNCLYFQVTQSVGVDQVINGITALQNNTKYYAKLVYDGTNYTMSLSTDGTTYTQEASAVAQYIPNSTDKNASLYGLHSQAIHMAECYIKKDGILVWQGMDTPGLHQRVPRGHEVVEFQRPTSTNSYTWYRKYADGWVEQGGIVPKNTGTSGTITLPVEMANIKYTVTSNTGNNAASNFFNIDTQEENLTTTTMNWYKSSAALVGSWEVKGMAQ